MPAMSAVAQKMLKLADFIRSGELALVFCHPEGKFPALDASQEQYDLIETALRESALSRNEVVGERMI